MSHVSDPRFLVLHGLRLKGFAGDETVARLTGLPAEEVGIHLVSLADDGLAQHREGRLTGWSLTPAGRARHAEHCAADVAASRARERVEQAYERFLASNQEFLTVCTEWQLRTGPDGTRMSNDHQDRTYDEGVIARLREIDAAIQPVCAGLATALARFSGYGPRLAEALTRVQDGELDWFTGPVIDSYHTVWFELHEDLLASLGRDRESEVVG